MHTSSSTDTSMTLDLLNFGSAGAINLTTVDMESGNIDSTVECRPELFIQLNCKKNARRDYNDSLRSGSINKATLHVTDHNEGLATARRDGDATFVSSQQRVECALLVWTKGQGHTVRC
jgi:hypothetical protein